MDWTEQAEQIVTLIRSQNWKNGGVLSVDHPEAVALVAQALATAYSGGQVDACQETGERMLQAFDTATDGLIGGPQTEAVKRFAKSGA